MKQNIIQEEYNNLSQSEKKNYVKEWVCICNECKHKWHYLDSVETSLNRQMSSNNCSSVVYCNPCTMDAMKNANTQLDKQLKELKQCPKCKSGNVKREARYFKKQA